MELFGGARAGSRLSMRRFHHTGVAPVKVLLVGDRAQLLDGDGADTQAERAADRIWLTTRRGVDVDVLVDLAPVLRAIAGVFGSWRLWRYDVVVVVLGDVVAVIPMAARVAVMVMVSVGTFDWHSVRPSTLRRIWLKRFGPSPSTSPSLSFRIWV